MPQEEMGEGEPPWEKDSFVASHTNLIHSSPTSEETRTAMEAWFRPDTCMEEGLGVMSLDHQVVIATMKKTKMMIERRPQL